MNAEAPSASQENISALIESLAKTVREHVQNHAELLPINNDLSQEYRHLINEHTYRRLDSSTYTRNSFELLKKYNTRAQTTFTELGLSDTPLSTISRQHKISARQLFNFISNLRFFELEEHQPQTRNENDKRLGKPLTIDMIVEAAKMHIEAFGTYPKKDNRTPITFGPLEGENWANIDQLLRRGHRDLPKFEGGLPALLKEFNLYNTISVENLKNTIQHHLRTKFERPFSNDNKPIEGGDLEGERFDNIHSAITRGGRGLPQYKRGLPEFIEKHFPVTKRTVMVSALAYQYLHPDNKFPSIKTPGKIKDGTILSGISFDAVSKRKIDGLTLSEIIKNYKNNPEEYTGIEEEAKEVADFVLSTIFLAPNQQNDMHCVL